LIRELSVAKFSSREILDGFVEKQVLLRIWQHSLPPKGSEVQQVRSAGFILVKGGIQ
jgi:hypothetical protein